MSIYFVYKLHDKKLLFVLKRKGNNKYGLAVKFCSTVTCCFGLSAVTREVEGGIVFFKRRTWGTCK